MAAYIMLAGDTLTFMPNAIVVLHNPWNCACGDYRAMAKMANLLEKLAALYAEQFVEKGIFTEKEIRSIMDEETWFVGKKDLAKLGQVETSEDESGADDLSQDRDIVIQAAMEKSHNARQKCQRLNLICNLLTGLRHYYRQQLRQRQHLFSLLRLRQNRHIICRKHRQAKL